MLSDYELSMALEDGREIPVMLNATLLLDAEGETTGVLVNARDVSELKRAQQELEHNARELARANEDLEEFASVASHDLQDPLRKVSQYAQRLIDRFEEFDPKTREEIGFIMEQAAHMRSLIKSVLAYARVGVGEVERVSVNCEEVFEQVLQNLDVLLEESGGEITHDPLPVVAADRELLLRVLQNLVGNAIKYADTETRKLRIHVSAQRIEAADLELPEAVAGTRGWLFSVEDNGIGIDPDFLEDVFKMFVRLHSTAEYPGSGMGLAIVWKIVGRLGGVIWAESEPGVGSVFRFTIPDLE